MTQKDSKIDIKFSVIIPYYQQKEALHKCLLGLSKQEYNGSVEILVVYHSIEDHLDQLKPIHQSVRWITNDQALNPYMSRNLGAHAATGEYLCFIDSSCYPGPNWLRELDIYISNNEDAQVLAGRIDVIPHSNAIKDQAHGVLYLNNEKNIKRNYGVPAGHLILSKKVFNEHGGFDIETISGNDIVFTRKLLKNENKIHYVDNAIVTYPGHDYRTLKLKMSKYATGVAHHEPRGIKAILFGFMPMRPTLFKQNLRYRNLDDLNLVDKIRLWFLIWRLKIHFNLGVMQGH